MAKKKKVEEVSSLTCRDCAKSYDYQHINHKGELFMCRCPHHKEGKYIKFLNDKKCVYFTPKDGIVEEKKEVVINNDNWWLFES